MTPGQEEKTSPFKGKILFMEDEELIRTSVSRILTHLGYEVALAREGDEAILKYKTARDSMYPFDVIMMDLSIRSGLGGLETMTKLLELDPGVKAVLASGHIDDPVTMNYRKYGFSEVITKPYEIDQLLELITRLIKQRS